MPSHLINLSVVMVLFPLLSALIAGLLGKTVGRVATHSLAVTLIGCAFLLSLLLFEQIVIAGNAPIDHTFYTWVNAGVWHFDVAFLIDRLSATMAMIVLFVSLMVHIYTIGYMAEDPGYQRFFSYVSLFTFAMLVLVFADNFLLLFFGWEGVGLVSYLLIGFWFTKEAAVSGGLKAFLVNRISDMGFILGTAAVLMYFNTLNYTAVFSQVGAVAPQALPIFKTFSVPALTAICVLFFIGAMGKSAQIPLHVWLPESMEGPTPISALIHAATMVTAGIYMVARLSPLYEYSPFALSMILIVGALTALLMGFLAVFQYDIKRIIAYSTLSQLGYMVVALGASAYNAAIFHLITHAFFKALLFLAAGSVIVALHHEQDIRKMGGLAKRLPITYLTFAIGCFALAAIPPFSGFYSKDAIIEAVKFSQTPGAAFAYACVLAGAFVTPLYAFRALFVVFHGPDHLTPSLRTQVKESPWVILLPLIALAIPSFVAGQILVGPMLFAKSDLLGSAIFVLPQHHVLRLLAEHYQGPTLMAIKASQSLTFWFAIAGIFTAWLLNIRLPAFANTLKIRFAWLYKIVVNKYGFDEFNQKVFVEGSIDAGHIFYDVSDVKIIDGYAVNGSGKLIQFLSYLFKRIQTGFIYDYVLVMVIGIFILLAWYVGVK